MGVPLQAAHRSKRLFNRTFSDEAGASPNWLLKANTSESPTGKAIVKVACIPVPKLPGQVSLGNTTLTATLTGPLTGRRDLPRQTRSSAEESTKSHNVMVRVWGGVGGCVRVSSCRASRSATQI